ncbi:unnamed protein product [Lathyrus oleraceus]
MTVMHGLFPALDELLLEVDQMFCVKHLYNNFRKKFPNVKLKELIWKTFTVTHSNAWEKITREMKSINEEAFKHLWKTLPRLWSKSRFKTSPRCDTLVNNMSKTSNSVFVATRASLL